MSSKARRIGGAATVIAFPWNTNIAAPPPAPASDAPTETASIEAVEQEAFARGFAQGERAGGETARRDTEAVVRELARTLDELPALRARMIRQTERQMVQLALAVARRVVHREISLDQGLLVVIARVALERLGEGAKVTLQLNPDDYEATGAVRAASPLGTNVTVVADPRVPRGGCRLDSELGTFDAGVDAQIQEIARALLSDEGSAAADDVITIN